MPEAADPFYNLGILPEGLPTPPARVRAELPRGAIAGQWAGIGCFGVLGLGMALVFVLAFPPPMSFIIAIGFVFLVVVLILRVFRDAYAWVELDDRTVRGKHFLTRQTFERSVDQIDEIVTLVNISAMPVVSDMLTGGRVQGFQIRFENVPNPIRVYRADPAMTNARELMEAIVFRMAQRRKIEAEIVNLEGTPLVLRLYPAPTGR